MEAKYCPECHQMVQFTTVPGSNGVIYRCNNCWAHYETVEDLPDRPQRRESDNAAAAKNR